MTPISSPATVHRSLWHSPVPYLFGGLAVMMTLIAFALLFLACSYWKFSRSLHNAGDGDPEAGYVKPDDNKPPTVFEPMCVAIMAGDEKPTFLATPSSSRTSSFGSNSCRGSLTVAEDSSEMKKDESSDQGQGSTMENQESADQ